tara:strand:- start:209 stop:952 length:744 start_codon:yes stop_codon:yes gene_type:complete
MMNQKIHHFITTIYNRFKEELSDAFFAAPMNFILLVVGVLVAFGVEKGQERRANKKIEKAHIERFIEDVKENISALKSSISMDSMLLEKGTYAQMALNKNMFPIDSLPVVLPILTQSQKLPFKKDTYQEIISQGHLHLITNNSIRIGIINYAIQYEGVLYQEDFYRQMMLQSSFPYVTQTFAIDPVSMRENPPQMNIDAIETLQFRNMITMFTSFVTARFHQYNIFLDINKNILQQCEEEIENNFSN